LIERLAKIVGSQVVFPDENDPLGIQSTEFHGRAGHFSATVSRFEISQGPISRSSVDPEPMDQYGLPR